MFVICFISRWMKRSKHGLFIFLPKKTLIWRRHCSIDQSSCSMTSKRSTRAFAKPTKNRERLYPLDKPIKSFYFRSFFVSVRLARFHFKVLQKSLYNISELKELCHTVRSLSEELGTFFRIYRIFEFQKESSSHSQACLVFSSGGL